MKIKKIILSTILCLSFTGCAVTDIAYDSYLLRSNFDSNFKYNVEILNTKEDNQKLLSSIQNNKKLMESLDRNKNENQIDHSYYLKYKLLKELVEKENSNKSNDSKSIVTKKESVKPKPVVTKKDTGKQKLVVAKKENVKQKPVVAKKENVKQKPVVTKKETIKQKPVVTKKETIKQKPVVTKKENVKQKPVVTKKETIKSKPIIKKEFKNEFFKIEKDLKPFYYIIISHCNVEDSYLLIEDVDRFKNKIKELEENEDAQNYIFEQYKKEIDSCLVFYYENKMLNPE